MGGKVYGVGLGPGDPELITLKAARVIAAADVVAYPAPPDGPSFARSIAEVHLNAQQLEIPVRMPLDPAAFPADEAYGAGAAAIAAELTNGKTVAVLCQGDPCLYGSFMYLFNRLSTDWPVEIIPGVSSLGATAGMAGRPLALRDEPLAVVPGILDDEALERLLNATEAAAILKVGRHVARLKALLSRLGLLDTALLVERATMPDARVRPLKDVMEDQAPYFSLILTRRRGAAVF